MADFKQLQCAFPPDTVLFKEEDTTREMYILLAGEVVVTKEGTELARISESGSFLGEMATLLNASRTATVTTTKKSVCLKILPENIDTLFKVTPELGYKLSKTLAQRLAGVTEKLTHLSHEQGDGAPNQATPAVKKQEKLSSKEVQASQAQVAAGETPEGTDPASRVAFLTRTEVHKDVLRYYFNYIGHKISFAKIIEDLDFPDTLCKLILKEFSTEKLISIAGDQITLEFSQELNAPIEEWIFAHGLFRMVG